MPKYPCWPLRVWCMSWSHALSAFLVELGAAMMVASTMVPVLTFKPRFCKCWPTLANGAPPSFCSWCSLRNFSNVMASGTRSRPRSMPAKRRRLALPYRASSNARSARLNQCCGNGCAACAPGQWALGRCLPWGSAALSPGTERPMALLSAWSARTLRVGWVCANARIRCLDLRPLPRSAASYADNV